MFARNFFQKRIFSILAREILGFVPKNPPIEIDFSTLPMDYADWYHGSGMPEEVDSVWVLFEYKKLSHVLKKWKYDQDTVSEAQIGDAYEKALKALPDF